MLTCFFMFRAVLVLLLSIDVNVRIKVHSSFATSILYQHRFLCSNQLRMNGVLTIGINYFDIGNNWESADKFLTSAYTGETLNS